jgi:hypothetical protein
MENQLKKNLFKRSKEILIILLFLMVFSIFNVVSAVDLVEANTLSSDINKQEVIESGIEMDKEEKYRILRSTENIVATMSSGNDVILPSLEKISDQHINTMANSISKYSSFLTDFSSVVNKENDASLFDHVLAGYRLLMKSLRLFNDVDNLAINSEDVYTLMNTTEEYIEGSKIKESQSLKNDFSIQKKELDVLIKSSESLIETVSILTANAKADIYDITSTSMNRYRGEYLEISNEYNDLVDEIVQNVEESIARVEKSIK